MIRIIGIDPGSRRTGYGIIDMSGATMNYVTSGIIRMPEGSLPERLQLIFDSFFLVQWCQLLKSNYYL